MKFGVIYDTGPTASDRDHGQAETPPKPQLGQGDAAGAFAS